MIRLHSNLILSFAAATVLFHFHFQYFKIKGHKVGGPVSFVGSHGESVSIFLSIFYFYFIHISISLSIFLWSWCSQREPTQSWMNSNHLFWNWKIKIWLRVNQLRRRNSESAPGLCVISERPGAQASCLRTSGLCKVNLLVVEFSDRLKTGWQDDWVRFRSWNLSDPATVEAQSKSTVWPHSY